MHTDALGNNIVLEAEYGYTITRSGVTDVVTGKAIKLTETKVSLLVSRRTSYLYGKLSTVRPEAVGTVVSVFSCNLFRV